MFEMLNVAIGVTFYFLLISIVAMAATEVVELVWKKRGTYLEKGVRALLQDKTGTGLAKAFYHHPLIRPLHDFPDGPEAGDALDAAADSPDLDRKPAYIPSRDFALALLDLVGLTEAPAQDPPPTLAQRLEALTTETVERLAAQKGLALNAAEVAALQRALRPLLADAGADLEKARTSIEAWYDSAMDRVSGWYKRHAQKVALVTGILLAGFLNADAVFVVQSLSENDGLRTAFVAAAEAYVQEAAEAATEPSGAAPTVPPDTTGADTTAVPVPADSLDARYREAVRRYEESVDRLAALGLPLGWERSNPGALWPTRLTVAEDARRSAYADSLERRGVPEAERNTQVDAFKTRLLEARPGAIPGPGDRFTWWFMKLLGLLLTGLAVSLGAPFWFDVLNKLMVVRSTVKPREKSPEEGSEDRRPAPGWDSIIPLARTKSGVRLMTVPVTLAPEETEGAPDTPQSGAAAPKAEDPNDDPPG